MRRVRSSNTEHQARRRKDSVVRTQYRRAQPADAFGAVSFRLAHAHSWPPPPYLRFTCTERMLPLSKLTEQPMSKS
jgi:hypothetical protein